MFRPTLLLLPLLALAINASAAPDAALSATATATTDPLLDLIKPQMVQSVRDAASDMVISAMNFLGVPYKRGGSTEGQGFDCSGFTRHIFELSIGLALPRRADEQARSPGLLAIQRSELKPGDLVFFNTLRRTFSHVGIYLGDDKFIHSPRSGGEVRIENLRDAYWAKRFTGARRAATIATAIPAPH